MTANFCTDIARQSIRIEGIPYSASEIRMVRMNLTNEGFRQELFTFLSEWFSAADTLMVHTSGSTGEPKPMQVRKDRMIQSACLTCSFLRLKENDTALLCMPLKYIAGKMVVVRSLVARLNLLPITPSGHPMKGLKEAPVFAAMTPMQVHNSLQVAEEKELLRQIKHLIIGGGAIDTSLADELKNFPHAVWSTYGMTETLSHIAMRRLNGPEASEWYSPFERVSIRLSQDNTLVIHAPHVCDGELVTNDIAEIRENGQFRIWGRKDNTINSGGIKIQIEQAEALLREHLSAPFLVTSMPDAKFGEVVVLLTEEESPEHVEQVCRQALPPYWCPKRIVHVTRIPLTGNGKPDRAKAKVLARQ